MLSESRPHPDRIKKLLNFWFGENSQDPEELTKRFSLWFKKNATNDDLIRKNYHRDLLQVIKGENESWKETPQGWLAYIVILDQFSRNIYRGLGKAFTQDAKALEACLTGIKEGIDKKLSLVERVFFYLPLEHAEDLALQNQSVATYQSLLSDAPEPLKKTFQEFLDYAEKHRSIIKKFGRFPHRNEFLERASTAQELAFLKEPGSAF